MKDALWNFMKQGTLLFTLLRLFMSYVKQNKFFYHLRMCEKGSCALMFQFPHNYTQVSTRDGNNIFIRALFTQKGERSLLSPSSALMRVSV
jgi:hypothetical protein